jgi:hypothetical protein
MFDIVFVVVFQAKFINHEGEQYVLCLVFPQSWRLFAFLVSVRCKSFVQQFVC